MEVYKINLILENLSCLFYNKHRKKMRFCHKLNFLIPISSKPVGVNLCYLKLKLVDLTEFVVIDIGLQRYRDETIFLCGKNQFLNEGLSNHIRFSQNLWTINIIHHFQNVVCVLFSFFPCQKLDRIFKILSFHLS